MSDRKRFYLTTAIAYANSAPGLHTVYEVIGSDVIARWHRMLGDDTRFLTGTDEHSVNIAQSAEALGITPRQFVDEKVALFKAAEDALLISPDRFIRTTDPDHYRSAQEMVRRAYDNGDIYQASYDGWYCPSEGFKAPRTCTRRPRACAARTTPTCPCSGSRRRTGSSASRPTRTACSTGTTRTRTSSSRTTGATRCSGFIRQGLQDFSISRAGATWGIPFPVMPDGSSSQLPDGTWDPAAGTIYVWYDALINYITGVGFPDNLDQFREWWPADLHVIGKDIARFHTIYWPAMLWSAGLDAPKHVWVHGWLLVQGGERMSKSRGNFLDPQAVVAAFGADGARYVTLREVAFDRDTEVSWDSFVRRYNADLANDFGNLVNRTVSMVNRYFGGERPEPREDGVSPLAEGWADTLRLYGEKLDARLLHDALGELWEYVGGANKTRRCRAAVDAGEAGEGRRCGRRGAAARRPGRPGGGLPAGGPGGRSVHARHGAARPGPARVRVPVRGGRQRRARDHGAPRLGRGGRSRPRD